MVGQTKEEVTMKLFKVVTLSRTSGRWEMWSNYAACEEAELAAKGLITGGAASECHILEIGKDGGGSSPRSGHLNKQDGLTAMPP